MYFHFFKASHKYEPQGFLQFPTVHLSKPREFKSKDFISLQTSLITLNFFLIIVLANKFRATKLVQEIIFLLLPDNKNLLNICIYLRWENKHLNYGNMFSFEHVSHLLINFLPWNAIPRTLKCSSFRCSS